MTSRFDPRQLLRPLALGLALLLVHGTQLSIAPPPVNAAALAPGPAAHADFVQATAEPSTLRADRPAEPSKSPPSSIQLPMIAASAVPTGTVLASVPTHEFVLTAPTRKGFDACGPPHLA